MFNISSEANCYFCCLLIPLTHELNHGETSKHRSSEMEGEEEEPRLDF